MNNFFKKIVSFKLKWAVKILLWRTKPEVIAITGSAGKTTTKEFLAHLLSVDFNVLAPAEGYNTEIGAPLSLFEEKTPVKLFSPLRWLAILWRIWVKALFTADLPQKVIIEMGADSPGDIKYLSGLFKPQKGIILSVLPVHLEQFKTVENIAAEKGELAKALPGNGILFLNYDDPRVREMSKKTFARVIYFGKEKKGDYIAKDLKSNLSGTEFTLERIGKKEQFSAKIYGKHIIYPLLSALAVAYEEGISAQKLKEAVSELVPFKGRMNILRGIAGSVIIDDSYNASPEAVNQALEFLSAQKGRKIAAIGTMGELGEYEEEGHRMVGKKVSQTADILITVGDSARKYLADAAVREGMERKNTHSFDNSSQAGEYLKEIIQKGDVVLIKGSQNAARMEKTVKSIMANPENAKDILVRQSDFWKEQL